MFGVTERRGGVLAVDDDQRFFVLVHDRLRDKAVSRETRVEVPASSWRGRNLAHDDEVRKRTDAHRSLVVRSGEHELAGRVHVDKYLVIPVSLHQLEPTEPQPRPPRVGPVLSFANREPHPAVAVVDRVSSSRCRGEERSLAWGAVAAVQMDDFASLVFGLGYKRERLPVGVEPHTAGLEAPSLPARLMLERPYGAAGRLKQSHRPTPDTSAAWSAARTACAPVASSPSCQAHRTSSVSPSTSRRHPARSVTASVERVASAASILYGTNE